MAYLQPVDLGRPDLYPEIGASSSFRGTKSAALAFLGQLPACAVPTNQGLEIDSWRHHDAVRNTRVKSRSDAKRPCEPHGAVNTRVSVASAASTPKEPQNAGESRTAADPACRGLSASQPASNTVLDP